MIKFVIKYIYTIFIATAYLMLLLIVNIVGVSESRTDKITKDFTDVISVTWQHNG